MFYFTCNHGLKQAIRRVKPPAYIDQNLDQRSCHRTVGLWVEETRSTTDVAAAASATDAVDIVLNALRQLEVDDVVHSSNVKATCGN